MKVLIILSYFIVTSCGVSGAGAPQVAAHGIAFVPQGAPSSQYHAQDELGQYSYGYSNSDGQAKAEVKGIDGSIAGKYTYIDAHGKRVEVSYIADKNGFRAIGDHLPSGVPTMPDHLKKAYDEANSRLAEAYSQSNKGKKNQGEGGEGGGGGEEEKEEEKSKGKGEEESKGEEEGKKEEEEEDEEEEEEEEEEEKGGEGGGGSEEEKESKSESKSSDSAKPKQQQQQPAAQQAVYGLAHLGYAVAPVAYVAVPPAQVAQSGHAVKAGNPVTSYVYQRPIYNVPTPVVRQPPPLPAIKPAQAGTAVSASHTVTQANKPSQTMQSYIAHFYSQPPQVHSEPSRVYFSQVNTPPAHSYGGYGVVQSHPNPSQYLAQASHVVPQVAVYSGPHLIGKSMNHH